MYQNGVKDMAEQGEVTVWLKAIDYDGGNVGSDTEFDITVNGVKTHLHTDIKARAKRLFDKPLFTHRTKDDEVPLTVTITVTEEDILVADVGHASAVHLIKKGQRRSSLPAVVVKVQEDRGILGAGVTAVFTFHLEAQYLATGTVTACCWNGVTDKTRTLASYYRQTQRHRLMADYIAGACAQFNLQTVVGHAIGAIEDGVSDPKPWVEGLSPSANWMQLDDNVIKREFIPYWHTFNATRMADPSPDDIFRYDVLNAAAGIWYLTTRSNGDFDDDGISYKTAMYKAMQYNWGPELTWVNNRSGCRTDKWDREFQPSAYAWTMAFLAWGNGYAVPDTRYTSQYAQYATRPTSQDRTWTYQEKRLSPLNDVRNRKAELTVPGFGVAYASQHFPYGRRRSGKQIVILARKTKANTDEDYISALTVALHIAKAFKNGIAPMVTADTYFACDSMKRATTDKTVCVIVLGAEARNDVDLVFPEATPYPDFRGWLKGTADGFVDASSSAKYQENYIKTLQEAVAAYRSGY